MPRDGIDCQPNSPAFFALACPRRVPMKIAAPKENAQPIGLIGGQGQNRTVDTRIFSPLLYRLSYLASLACSVRVRIKPDRAAGRQEEIPAETHFFENPKILLPSEQAYRSQGSNGGSPYGHTPYKLRPNTCE